MIQFKWVWFNTEFVNHVDGYSRTIKVKVLRDRTAVNPPSEWELPGFVYGEWIGVPEPDEVKDDETTISS